MDPYANALAKGYASGAGTGSVYQGPVFSEVLPFYQAWGQMQPAVEAEGRASIDPYVNRQLRSGLTGFYNQMAGEGAGRFGKAMGQAGSLRASAEQQRKAQLLDWINTRQQGFRQLWYEPMEQSWTEGMGLNWGGQAPTVPTWDEYMAKYGI